ncbi:MAG: DNA topoisomerase, partial [Oscillospiraceae bacterium]|nr:DNA topoisomerase [Oscillospiraceae bacterium]
MAKTVNKDYGNESISSLKGADRVRKRPGVIFGSDGLEGCEHAVFEILSNSIDEAREGHGRLITVTRYADHSIEVEDQGRGCPVDYNPKEERFNWELVFCELYAGGKYDNREGENYEYSLGLNGLGSCATQYASRYMDVTVWRDGNKYSLHFERGEPMGEPGRELIIEPTDRGKKTGTRTRWLPDLDVFTDIDIPAEYYIDTMKRQAVVNAGVTFRFRNEVGGKFETTEFLYENGIIDYVSELAGEDALTAPVFWETERRGRDRDDKEEYRVKLSASLCFSNRVNVIEHYHNSSWLEHGGSPDKATRSALVSAIDAYIKQSGKYTKNESKITFNDVQDCLVMVSNNFSTRTSYENQTKKAITNRFVQEAMTEFLRENLNVYFIENPTDAARIAEQVLINKRSRETAEKARLNIKKKLSGSIDIANRVQKFVDCRTRDVEKREIYIVEGDSALGSVKLSRDAEFQGIMPVRGKILNCLKADYARIFKSE